MIDGIVVMGKFELMKFGWELKLPRLLALSSWHWNYRVFDRNPNLFVEARNFTEVLHCSRKLH
jgi:hypothetical protein